MRLDQYLVEKGYFPTREQARKAILAGEVEVEGKGRSLNPGSRIGEEVKVLLRQPPRYVSRGGYKLENVLKRWSLSVEGLEVLDIGSSTGGFCDCLLQRGASRVIALDVGRGQLHWKLRNDPRVVVLEGINARYLTRETLPFDPDLVTLDVSFISARLILEPLRDILKSGTLILFLIKPQFEAGRGKTGKGGVIRKMSVHLEVLGELLQNLNNLGYGVRKLAPAFPRGAGGNIEYFALLVNKGEGETEEKIEYLVKLVVGEAWKTGE
jgi:23S rRNA (cytidine1920-2'-O)/16S rRNA (cytidine1409-2'-O)-methyltransferase